AGADAVLALMRERPANGSEPPPTVAAAMLGADVILAPTVQSLSHTSARRAASAEGARVATLPGVNEEMLARVMSADMAELRRRGGAVAGTLSAGSEARITAENGTDLTLGLGEREAIPDAGDLTASGAFGNLPCGEGFISPIEGTANGRLVADGTIGSLGTPGEPASFEILAGNVVSASGPEGERLLDMLRAAGEGGTNVAELGIGTNECARVTGNLLEDEKILGTCHVAFGASASIGGTVQVPIHEDVVVMRPVVAIDGKVILRDGELLV
ncbi:MAG: aminopeptidase, partial [Solirubrobacterales bacterium]|nr:aminopeptidase [Solirubrobacterales bacterium]